MLRSISLLSAVLILCVAPVVAQRAEPIDIRLAGAWEGARTEGAACDTYIWRVERSPNGKYVVAFFGDPEMTDLINSATGVWWTKDGVFYERSAAQKNARNAYRYTVKAGKEVYFEYIAPENEKKASDCEAEYSFTESRKAE